MLSWLSMPLDAKKDEPNPYPAVSKCARCGCGHLSTLPSLEEIPAFYELDSYYTHGESHVREVAPSPLDKALTKLAWMSDDGELFDASRIAKSLPPSARVCDLGCGHAAYLQQFNDLGVRTVGVEPDPSARHQAAAAGVTVLAGTAEDLPELEDEFDLVLCTHALEHCRDAPKALRNAYDLTTSGGICYVEVPNCSSEHFQTFTICSENFDAPRHIWFFTPESLQRLAERTGFTVQKRLFSGYTRNFSPSWRAWEREIAKRLTRIDAPVRPRRHSFAASVSLLLRSFWRRPEQKYDSVGLILSKPYINP